MPAFQQADEFIAASGHAVYARVHRSGAKGKACGDGAIERDYQRRGRPENVQVVRGLGMGLDENAREALRQWVFRRAQKDGHAVAVAYSVEMHFRLN